MAFTTKKYTRPLLLQELRSVNARQFQSFQTFVSAFSPRAGANSAKVTVLADLLGGKTNLRKYFTAGRGVDRKNAIISVLKTSV